jgi:hypothetical protein
MMPFSFFKAGRGVRRTFAALVCLPMLLIFAYIIILPVLKLSHKDGPVAVEAAPHDTLTAPSDNTQVREQLLLLHELKLQDAEQRAQIQLTRLDSIYFFVDLNDSLAAIQISGVKLRKCKLTRFYASPMLPHIKQSEEAVEWLSRPLVAQQSWSTFVKHPFKIKNAPKDTLEALAMKQEIMAPEPIDAYCTILFDRNILLRMHQIEKPSRKGAWQLVKYECAYQFSRLKVIVNALSDLQLPPHYITIDLALPQADIVAMFRAVPYACSMMLLF